MKICNFTQTELDLFREECNFTDIESRCFELKAKDWTDVQISMELSVSESTVAVTMRRVRTKIDEVLKHNVRHLNQYSNSNTCGRCIVCHTMTEWAKIPDFLSGKGVIYIYSDYRTENNVNIPRIKIGDGINPLSELPFATMSITDKDMEYWDGKPDTENNNFGKVVIIDESYAGENRLVFPTDGYVMLEFDDTNDEFAIAKIYGAKGDIGFEFSKKTDHDAQSKEVFVRKGMRCEYIDASKNAVIKFVPLV